MATITISSFASNPPASVSLLTLVGGDGSVPAAVNDGAFSSAVTPTGYTLWSYTFAGTAPYYTWTAQATFASGLPSMLQGTIAGDGQVSLFNSLPAASSILNQLYTARASGMIGVNGITVDGMQVQLQSPAQLDAAILFWERKVAILSGRRRRVAPLRLI